MTLGLSSFFCSVSSTSTAIAIESSRNRITIWIRGKSLHASETNRAGCPRFYLARDAFALHRTHFFSTHRGYPTMRKKPNKRSRNESRNTGTRECGEQCPLSTPPKTREVGRRLIVRAEYRARRGEECTCACARRSSNRGQTRPLRWLTKEDNCSRSEACRRLCLGSPAYALKQRDE